MVPHERGLRRGSSPYGTIAPAAHMTLDVTEAPSQEAQDRAKSSSQKLRPHNSPLVACSKHSPGEMAKSVSIVFAIQAWRPVFDLKNPNFKSWKWAGEID